MRTGGKEHIRLNGRVYQSERERERERERASEREREMLREMQLLTQ
jgi:hypothetical protein